METTLFSVFVSSLIICIALIPPLRQLAGPFHLLDLPEERKVHAAPIVRIGGIAFAAGSFVSILIFAPMDRRFLSYLIGALIILFFGVWDDRANLDFKLKFLAQLAAILIVVGYGGIQLQSVPFLEGISLSQWLAIPLTILALLGITNAINLSDGLDGLAGGLCLLSFAALAYLAYLAGDSTVMILSCSVLGGLLGFLRFNTHPARIFMGDGGSQFLGFSAGVSAVELSDPSQAPYSPILILLIIGLPILDTLLVMSQRVSEGRSPFLPDKKHLHHKLLTVGFFHHEAVIGIYLFQSAMIALAYLVRWQSDSRVLAVYSLVAMTVFIFSALVSRGRFRWRRPAREQSASVAFMRRLKGSKWIMELPFQLLGIGVLIFLVFGAFVPDRVPIDFGFLAIFLFCLLLAGLLLLRRAIPFLIRPALYVAGTFLIYLGEQGFSSAHHAGVNLFFGLMSALVVITIQLHREKSFEVTPLDYLVVLGAILVTTLPEIKLGEIPIRLLLLKLIVLFFAFELVLNRLSHRLVSIGVVVLWVLFILGVRAWIA